MAKEDPEVYKHWHDWYGPRAKQPLWLKPNSPQSLERLMEALDTAIKERIWTYSRLGRDPTTPGPHALYEETAFVTVAPWGIHSIRQLDAYLSALKGCRGDEICPWLH